jgi:hypothetical protein
MTAIRGLKAIAQDISEASVRDVGPRIGSADAAADSAATRIIMR